MLIANLRKLEAVGAIAAVAIFGSGLSAAQTQAPKKITANTLQQVSVGALPGKWDMKATMLIIEPGGEIPFHVHKGPGLRHVLEGAITINWKEGKTQTFEAGSTYFEGPGENHPAGTMSARNGGQGPCRVVIVELVPHE
jgi:quercetin dioxygenase-like cupin family protein